MQIEGEIPPIGYDAEGHRRTWNHRVVRRYATDGTGREYTYLELTEVHYSDAKPESFAVELRAPAAGGEPDDPGDAQLLADLRTTLERMLAAIDRPILDERRDFPDAT